MKNTIFLFVIAIAAFSLKTLAQPPAKSPLTDRYTLNIVNMIDDISTTSESFESYVSTYKDEISKGFDERTADGTVDGLKLDQYALFKDRNDLFLIMWQTFFNYKRDHKRLMVRHAPYGNLGFLTEHYSEDDFDGNQISFILHTWCRRPKTKDVVFEYVSRLIDSRNIRDDYTSVLNECAKHSSPERVYKVAKTFQIDPNTELHSNISRWGETVLIWAAKSNSNANVVQTLIDLGASVNARDSVGTMALYYALKYNENPDVTLILLENGAEVEEGYLSIAQDNPNPDVLTTIRSWIKNKEKIKTKVD